MLVGVHESVKGGLERAFFHADSHGCSAVQIFTKNASQWKEPALAREQVRAFREAHAAWGGPVLAHQSYLVNLCSDQPQILERSVEAVYCEMARSSELGIASIALHPGACMGLTEPQAIARAAESLSTILERTRGLPTQLCLENTAGQGTCLGFTIDQLASLLRSTDGGQRLGVCIDTQHTFAAGYDLAHPEGYDAFWKEFEDKIGLRQLSSFHLNDSKKPLGSRVDRHEEIGKGEMGLYPFWRLMNDPRLADVPGIVELPPEAAAASLARLSGLIGAVEPAHQVPCPTSPPPAPASGGKRKKA